MEEVLITREDFERQFDYFPSGAVEGITIYGVFGPVGVHFRFVGKKQDDLQQLERIYQLQGAPHAEK